MLKVWAKQADIAKEAGVSLATVDRVLNDRPGVSIRTANKIWKAIEILQQENEVKTPALRQPLNFDVILPAGPNTFLNILEEEIKSLDQQLTGDNISLKCHRIEGFAPNALADYMIQLADKTDGLAVMALENPLVREAIHRLHDQQIPVVTMVSNISTEKIVGYVGLNNRSAGRTAAYILNMINQKDAGEIAIFEGSIDLAYSDHQEREFGFRDALREYNSPLQIAGRWATQDNHIEAYNKTIDLLQNHPEITAIYCIGGGARGVARALEYLDLGHKIHFIAHEITNYTRDYLLKGTLDAIIHQDPAREAKEAIQMLTNFCRGTQISKSTVYIPTEIYFRENLP